MTSSSKRGFSPLRKVSKKSIAQALIHSSHVAGNRPTQTNWLRPLPEGEAYMRQAVVANVYAHCAVAPKWTRDNDATLYTLERRANLFRHRLQESVKVKSYGNSHPRRSCHLYNISACPVEKLVLHRNPILTNVCQNTLAVAFTRNRGPLVTSPWPGHETGCFQNYMLSQSTSNFITPNN